jgi:hypothetical protein
MGRGHLHRGQWRTTTINELGVCKKVTNSHASGLSLMVPTGSASEWYTGGNSFIQHPPPGVTLAVCTCSLPWGGSINDGSSTTAYQASSVVRKRNPYLRRQRAERQLCLCLMQRGFLLPWQPREL